MTKFRNISEKKKDTRTLPTTLLTKQRIMRKLSQSVVYAACNEYVYEYACMNAWMYV